ncbi:MULTISPECIES: GAF and ANTAR domain-containing protein [unclassified Knoellia]|uniref:GAF and ANTAR domain-containing protein n=1 Tax=Knoellia altitudinis TaxID=3404795 RepID=UPI00362302AE
MTGTREHDIIRVFVEMSNELVDGYDVVDLLSDLTTNCATLLDVASAGLLLADGRGVLHVAAASSERTQHLETFQLQREEGPCLDCYHSGEPVIVPAVAEEAERWPQFSRRAESMGFASVHAIPMRLRDNVLGALGLFGDRPGQLNDDDLDLAQAMAHVASVALVNEKSASDLSTVNAQLEHALVSRVALEQAKGIIANISGLDMQDAFTVLRRYARDHGHKLTDVSTQLVNRELDGDRVLAHARRASILG